MMKSLRIALVVLLFAAPAVAFAFPSNPSPAPCRVAFKRFPRILVLHRCPV